MTTESVCILVKHIIQHWKAVWPAKLN